MAGREPTDKDSRLKSTSAVLDEAHLGDIHGAFGTIRLSDVAPRRTWRRRVLTLAAIVGPGLIVMVGDNDAGGVSTYAQAGQDFGYSLLWTRRTSSSRARMVRTPRRCRWCARMRIWLCCGRSASGRGSPDCVRMTGSDL